tara:strand:+ start:41 stop:253 length:213 start_codon:yes stop_codon:yes gene_type:complete
MEAITPPKESPAKPRENRTKTVLIHLTPGEYSRTIQAADSDGLQTGPWLRMHLLRILRGRGGKENDGPDS